MDKKVDETIKTIKDINNKLADPKISNRQRKRLTRELESYGRVLQDLEVSRFSKINDIRTLRIERALSSIEGFKDRKVKTISSEAIEALFIRVEELIKEFDKATLVSS